MAYVGCRIYGDTSGNLSALSMGSTESAFGETPNAQPGSVESSDIFNSLTRLRLPKWESVAFVSR